MSNELYHYGIKGMKWGVRKQREPSEKKSKKKRLKDMSDEELSKKLKRMNLENQYKKLTEPKRKVYGRKFVDTVLVGSAFTLSSAVVQQYGRKYLKKLKILK